MTEQKIEEPFEVPSGHSEDHECCGCCCEDDCLCYDEPATKQDPEDLNKTWPLTNGRGNCWCGHSSVFHAVTEDKPNCIECQCVGFTLDNWEKHV